MPYTFEHLTDDRFQKLCQSLLVAEFPNVRCFPVNQSDGGRDATVRLNADSKKFYVFQVKHSSTAHKTAQEVKRWLVSTLKAERDKIVDLMQRGAEHYYLLTNVSGTGYPDSGTIDFADALQSEFGPISITIWWRDDLERRLDLQTHLKWTFIEGASGPDLLSYLLAIGNVKEDRRRHQALRAFLEDQLQKDASIRFKQVDLNNDLFDLYIDPHLDFTPAEFAEVSSSRDAVALAILRSPPGAKHGLVQLLASLSGSEGSAIVIEGGPGQGKSTSSQMICQIHRLRLLEKESVIRSHSSQYRPRTVRFPIKVDLRDFATWLDHKNPFSEEQETIEQADYEPTLECFLAKLIRHFSGGCSFTVEDILETSRNSALLVLLDGLDEVADVDKRAIVIKKITEGVKRIRANCPSAVVIVTSRPTAFSNEASFPRDQFHYFKVSPLSREQITEYAQKWVSASKLDDTDKREVIQTLGLKLKHPHIQELSKNPMQLSILLNLIYRKGSSMPDKRTALYDSYVDIFLDRECEKSPSVREHRSLFLALHQYLAIKIHLDSEEGAHDGRIPIDEFRREAKAFLKHEEQEQVFSAAIEQATFERLGFLVSRTQGIVEFEVQPLREYFAARFLKDTAPVSSAGSECQGSIADRFDAILGNPYWLNVCRFLAGCLDKGELPMVVERLRARETEAPYSESGYCKSLGGVLVRDYVFAQSRPTLLTLFGFLREDLDLLMCQEHSNYTRGYFEDPLRWPEGGGAELISSACKELALNETRGSWHSRQTRCVALNSNPGQRLDFWLSSATTSVLKERWLSAGRTLKVLRMCPAERVLEMLPDETSNRDLVNLAEDHYLPALFDNAKWAARVTDVWLSSDAVTTTQLSSFWRNLYVLHNGIWLAGWLRNNADSAEASLGDLIDRSFGRQSADFAIKVLPPGHPWIPLERLEAKMRSLLDLSAAEWTRTSGPGKAYLREAEKHLGATRALQLLSIHLVPNNTPAVQVGKLVSEMSLTELADAVALNRDSASWWRQAFGDYDGPLNCLLVAMCFTQTTNRCFNATVGLFEDVLCRMTADELSWVVNCIEAAGLRKGKAARQGRAARRRKSVEKANLSNYPLTAALLLAFSTTSAIAEPAVSSCLKHAPFESAILNQLLIRKLHALASKKIVDWDAAYFIIERCYSSADEDAESVYPFAELCPQDLARKIISNKRSYPPASVAEADLVLQMTIPATLQPVSLASKDQGWLFT